MILDCSLKLLRDGFNEKIQPSMSNPVKVSRVLAAMVINLMYKTLIYLNYSKEKGFFLAYQNAIAFNLLLGTDSE